MTTTTTTIPDYRGDKRLKIRPRKCEACKDLFVDVSRGLKTNTCPPCLVASGRYEWRDCVQCGSRYASAKEGNRQLVNLCRQCGMKSSKARDYARAKRQQRSAAKAQGTSSMYREPVTLATLDPDAFLSLCERAEKTAPHWVRAEIDAEIERWKKPLSAEQYSAWKRKGSGWAS